MSKAMIRGSFLTLAVCAAFLASVESARKLESADAALPGMVFPPYACDRDLAISPFYISPMYTTLGKRVCFTVRTKTPEKVSPCNAMEFYKFELKVDPVCKNAISKVTVNGRDTVAPTFQLFDNGKQALIKMPQIGLTNQTADNAQICMTLGGVCPTMGMLSPEHDGSFIYSILNDGPCTCCPVGPAPPPPSPRPPRPPSPSPPSPLPPSPRPPSPPPPPEPVIPKVFSPPPPLPFPYCRCDRTAGVSPYSLMNNVAVSKKGANNVYTFQINVSTPINPSSVCGTSDLYKVEFWSGPECRKAVKNAYINGIKVSPMYDVATGVWRVANLRMEAATAMGETIGLELDIASACPTLSKLANKKGGNAVYSMFNTKRDCCPVGYNIKSNV